MPYLIGLFGGAIKYLAAYAVFRVFAAIGLSYVVYQGMDTLLDNIRANIEGEYSGILANVHAVITLAGVDVAISILFSAVSIRLLINGFTGGSKAALRLTGVGGS